MKVMAARMKLQKQSWSLATAQPQEEAKRAQEATQQSITSADIWASSNCFAYLQEHVFLTLVDSRHLLGLQPRFVWFAAYICVC